MIEKDWRPADWTNKIPVEKPRSLELGVYPVLPEPDASDTEEWAALPKWAEYALIGALVVIALAIVLLSLRSAG